MTYKYTMFYIGKRHTEEGTEEAQEKLRRMGIKWYRSVAFVHIGIFSFFGRFAGFVLRFALVFSFLDIIRHIFVSLFFFFFILGLSLLLQFRVLCVLEMDGCVGSELTHKYWVCHCMRVFFLLLSSLLASQSSSFEIKKHCLWRRTRLTHRQHMNSGLFIIQLTDDKLFLAWGLDLNRMQFEKFDFWSSKFSLCMRKMHVSACSLLLNLRPLCQS